MDSWLQIIKKKRRGRAACPPSRKISRTSEQKDCEIMLPTWDWVSILQVLCLFIQNGGNCSSARQFQVVVEKPQSLLQNLKTSTSMDRWSETSKHSVASSPHPPPCASTYPKEACLQDCRCRLLSATWRWQRQGVSPHHEAGAFQLNCFKKMWVRMKVTKCDNEV